MLLACLVSVHLAFPQPQTWRSPLCFPVMCSTHPSVLSMMSFKKSFFAHLPWSDKPLPCAPVAFCVTCTKHRILFNSVPLSPDSLRSVRAGTCLSHWESLNKDWTYHLVTLSKYEWMNLRVSSSLCLDRAQSSPVNQTCFHSNHWKSHCI